MKSRKVFLVQVYVLIIIIIFFILTPSSSQVKKDEIISFSGTIKTISEDLKTVVVNDMKVFISPDTKIFGGNGNNLKINELKPKLYVIVEALENSDGIFAKKIVVKKPEAE